MRPLAGMIMGSGDLALPWPCRYGDGMIGPVRAQPHEPFMWIRSGWDRAVPSRFIASTDVDGFAVTLIAMVGQRGPGAIEVNVSQPAGGGGSPVTLAVLRKVTVDQIIRAALDEVSRPAASAELETGIPGTFRVQDAGGIYGGAGVTAAGRGRDTHADRLVRVAEIYRAARQTGRAPVQAVAAELPSSRSTAGRLVGMARQAGLLKPTTQGRPGPDGLQPIAAAIVTSRKGVLAGRRNDGKPPWTFIAGEVEPDEDPADAAVREVKEETGLEVRAAQVIGERDHPATGRHMIYLAARPVRGTSVHVGDEAELAEVRWLTMAEADELLPGMYEPVRAYLEQALRGRAARPDIFISSDAGLPGYPNREEDTDGADQDGHAG